MPGPSNQLWLDDIRRPIEPEGWHWARTIEQAKLIVRSHEIRIASLDHDMGLHEFDPDEPNADVMRVPARYKCYVCRETCGEVYDMRQGFFAKPKSCPTCGESDGLKAIGDPDGAEFCEWLVKEGLVPEIVYLHSMNPVGAKRMFDILTVNCSNLFIRPFDPSCRNA